MDCSCGPTVMTRCGEVRGSVIKTKYSKKPIFSFRGIPFAKPPLGKRRFKRSEPYGQWNGVWNGKKESRKSLQGNPLLPDMYFLREGSEDCLYLNISTKSLDPSDPPRPVIVFLHGGAFMVGSCENMLYGPNIILERNVVFVGVNYRLGMLGWLSLETDAAPGNLGLHDQYLALLWVKENIDNFGGDPNNITLMGESAGAMSALVHLVSPMSKGLINRVVALSGTPTSSFMHNDRQPLVYAERVAQHLGCHHTDPDAILEYLQNVPAIDILKSSVIFKDWDHVIPMPWVPIVDSYATEPMMPKKWEDLVREGAGAGIPLIMGCCRDEGLILSAKIFKNKKHWSLLARDWDRWAPVLLFNREQDLISSLDKNLCQDVKRFYFGEDTDVSDLPPDDETLLKVTEMLSMSWFHQAFYDDSQLLSQAGSTVFNFILSVQPNFSFMDLFRLRLRDLGTAFAYKRMGRDFDNKKYGVCHGDDLTFIFPMAAPGFPEFVQTNRQKETQTRMLDLLESFALTGVPNSPEFHGVWQPISTAGQYLDIGASLKMDLHPDFINQVKFWSDVKRKISEERGSKSVKRITTLYSQLAVKRIPRGGQPFQRR